MDALPPVRTPSPSFRENIRKTGAARNQSVAMALSSLRQWLHDAGVPLATNQDFIVAVAEALNNAWQHASGQNEASLITLACDLTEGTLWAEITDSGHFVPPADPPTHPLDPLSEHGRGLILIAALCDRVEHKLVEGGHCLRLELRSRKRHL